MTWKDDLVHRCQHLFGPGGHPTVGDGWRDLLERALARIEAARGSGSVEIVQIKKKFGTLRLYWGGKNISKSALARIEEAIALAEARSACTCEECGAEGRLYDRSGWYLTRCPLHASGDAVEARPGWSNLRVVTKYSAKTRVTSARRYDRERDMFIPAPVPEGYDDE